MLTDVVTHSSNISRWVQEVMKWHRLNNELFCLNIGEIGMEWCVGYNSVCPHQTTAVGSFHLCSFRGTALGAVLRTLSVDETHAE